MNVSRYIYQVSSIFYNYNDEGESPKHFVGLRNSNLNSFACLSCNFLDAIASLGMGNDCLSLTRRTEIL